MSLRFLAGALSIPFIPTKSGLGSDLMNYEGFPPDIRREKKVASKKYAKMQNPFSEQRDEVVLLPALTPDSPYFKPSLSVTTHVADEGLTFADNEQASGGPVNVTFETSCRVRSSGPTPTRTHCLPFSWMP
jgi:glutaconate CoA-transferase subunit A